VLVITAVGRDKSSLLLLMPTLSCLLALSLSPMLQCLTPDAGAAVGLDFPASDSLVKYAFSFFHLFL
jgi:hypothetical protein